MSFSTCDRIRNLIDSEKQVSVKDAAGVIRPEGIDSVVRLKAYAECLKIAQDVEEKSGRV